MSVSPPSVPITTKAGMDFYIQSAKFTRQFSQRLRTIQRLPGLANGLTSVLKRNAYYRGTISTIEDKATKASKSTEQVRKNLEKLLEKTPGGNTAQKASKASAQLGQIAVLAGIVVFLVAKQVADIRIQDMGIENDNVTRSEIQKAFDRFQKNAIDIRGLNKQIQNLEKLTKQRLANEDRLYAETGGAVQNAAKARELANNALYETRQGRKILESQVATANKKSNDALYETRQGRRILESQITAIQTKINQSLSSIGQGFQQQINSTIANIQRALATSQSQIAKNNAEVISQNAKINSLQVSNANLQSSNKLLDAKVNAIKQLPVQTIDVNAIVTSAKQAVFSEVNNLKGQINNLSAQFSNNQSIISTLNGAISSTANTASQANAKADVAIREAQKNQQELQRIGSSINQNNSDISQLEKQVKETDKVNQEGNKQLKEIGSKLDSIIPAIAGIPLVVGKAADNIIKNTPTIPDIEKAAATGVCRSTQPGGCMNKALNDQASDIKNNTNNNTGNILDAFNTGANAAQLTLLETINTKLGDLLPGGISGTFSRLWKTKQVDRIINILVLITTFHNGAMLSNNILQTLFSGIDNLSQAAGFKWENEKGEETGFGGLVSEWTGNFFKTIFGETTYNNINATWNAANRTYQSVTNALWNIQGMFDSVRSVGELAVSYTGKIGNALKRGGALFEDAFPDMTEVITARTAAQAKWDAALQNLQPIENVVSAFSSVTGEIVSIGDNFNELKNQRDEFLKSKDDGEKAVTALITGEKLASQVNQPINSADVQKSDD